MNKIIETYNSSVLVRYDKDGIIPYYSVDDFPNLQMEKHTFINSAKDKIAYFFYYYKGYKKDEIILFCHGIGPGHTAYLREIELLAKKGYKVLTLDYSGCGDSSGEKMVSMNAPTRDTAELLKYLNLKEKIKVVGHSLGGYTALNMLNLFPDIEVGVIISGFISIYLEMKNLAKFGFIANMIAKYERDIIPEYAHLNNETFLFKTDKKILFIHSKDDPMVRYKDSTKIVKSLKNNHLSFEITNGYYHNPNYSLEAVNYMREVFGRYAKLLKEDALKTEEDKKNYFSDVSLDKLTEQSEEIWEKIFAHLL